jgi:NADH-quinone oxidoreductase subunit A
VSGYFGAYALVGVLVLTGFVLCGGMTGANRLLRPHHPTDEKLRTYECGVDPVGDDWAQTQIRYYVYAFLYVVFAVESVFLFPWATVFARLGATSLVEMAVFIGILAVALLYAYRKRVLEWV